MVGTEMDERMLKWFANDHDDPELQAISMPFAEMARIIDNRVPSGPERTVAFRKLLESMDAAVRAVVNPGG